MAGKRELAVQTDIIKSARKDGGYGRKMSNQFVIGIPDLLIGLYPFAPCLAEVKDLAECVDKFDRQLEVTPKQDHELRLFSEVYETRQVPYTPNRRAGLLLIHVLHRNEHRLVALPRGTERLSHHYQDDPSCWRKRQPGNYYDIAPLLEHVGIIKVKLL